MKKKIIDFIFIFLVLSCSSTKTKIHKLGNLYIKIPKNFKSATFILPNDIARYVSSYSAFDYKTQNAMFTVFDTRYKKEYLNTLDLKKSAEGVIRDLRNKDNTVREFSITEQKILNIGDIEGYYAKCEFFYGPNKTIAEIVLFTDGGILQILAMYNKNHRKSAKIMENIVLSITEKEPK